MKEFFEKCADAGCVVVPVKTYSGYGADENIHAEQFTGIRFAALGFDNEAVGPDYWFMIDQGKTGLANLYETPEAALAAFVAKRPND